MLTDYLALWQCVLGLTIQCVLTLTVPSFQANVSTQIADTMIKIRSSADNPLRPGIMQQAAWPFTEVALPCSLTSVEQVDMKFGETFDLSPQTYDALMAELASEQLTRVKLLPTSLKEHVQTQFDPNGPSVIVRVQTRGGGKTHDAYNLHHSVFVCYTTMDTQEPGHSSAMISAKYDYVKAYYQVWLHQPGSACGVGAVC